MSKLNEVIEYSEKYYGDGHFTLLKFTTNWRACFGTFMAYDAIDLRGHIQQCAVGKTMNECLENLLKNPVSAYDMIHIESIEALEFIDDLKKGGKERENFIKKFGVDNNV